jgi:Tfp pilus assembly protein PilE
MTRLARRGISLLELLAATVVLAALMAAVAQVAVLSAGQHAAMERRMLALSEAQQLVERISAMPWGEITETRLGEFTPSPELLKALPAAELAVSVADETGSPPGKRIVVEISWHAQPDVRARPVRLVTWRFVRGDAS